MLVRIGVSSNMTVSITCVSRRPACRCRCRTMHSVSCLRSARPVTHPKTSNCSHVLCRVSCEAFNSSASTDMGARVNDFEDPQNLSTMIEETQFSVCSRALAAIVDGLATRGGASPRTIGCWMRANSDSGTLILPRPTPAHLASGARRAARTYSIAFASRPGGRAP